MALIDLENPGAFEQRHTGPNADQEALMLSVIGAASRAALMTEIVPASIARETPMALPPAVGESEALRELQVIASQNEVCTSWIGQGYYGTHTPGVILRNILENPAWYTAYTPYQAEISQGRMEALVNFQTMVCDLTGMPIANASMLDEATAAAEAMTLAKRSVKSKGMTIVVSGECHPQTIEVIQTRAAPLGMAVIVPQTPADWATALRVPITSPSCASIRARLDALMTSAPMSRKSMPTKPPSSWRPICWPLPSWSRQVKWVPTSWWAQRSASGCPWVMVVHTPLTWPVAMS